MVLPLLTKRQSKYTTSLGHQHKANPNARRKDLDAARWVSKRPIDVHWLANDAGAAAWPPTDVHVARVRAAFDPQG